MITAVIGSIPTSTTTSNEWRQMCISGSPYTVEWILKALEKNGYALDGRDLVDVAQSNINDGNGFVTQILRVVLNFKDQQRYSIVLKIPDADLISQSFGGEVNAVHVNYFNQEIRFYQSFLPHLSIPLPKIYEMVKWVPGEAAGAILMEDLSDACTIQNVSKGLTLEQLLNIAEHLADLHNSFLKLPEDRRRTFEDDFPPNGGCMDFQVTVVIDRAAEIARKYKAVIGNRLNKFLDILKDPVYHYYTAASVSEAFGLPRVITHGDLWSNNILWMNSDPTKVGAVLDWQGFCVGSLTFDLSRILVLCTSASVRRENTDLVIAQYYRKLENFGFSKSQVMQAYNETVPYQCAHMLFTIQLLESRLSEDELEEMLHRSAAAFDDIQDYEIVYKKK
ncbi:hypothetical protein QR680_013858 [Steinernema hermaphroditum]|uniref:CHK kinase-like domain-containing protein n=1 Tax=Steinernema hermaphroditum TaxID=289476 RepID=A0AA39I6X7_9BILA|nr:hypothetical protein QR680_013858 [Steinernema hermaphroditum]